MTKTLKITIWGRDFVLPVEFEYYDEEVETTEQIDALKKFDLHPEWITGAKRFVEKFCFEKVRDDEENLKKDNIFSYVKPEYVFVKRDKKNARVALMCKYRYDLEHGLAVVFTSDGDVSVGLQDMIL